MNLSAESPQSQGITLDEAAERLMTPPSENTIEEVQEESVSSEPDSETTIEESNETSMASELPKEEDPEYEVSEEDEPVAEEAKAVEEPQSDDIESLNDWLSEANDQYSNIVIPTKINGEHGQVPLSELVKNYQIGESVEQRAEEMKARKAEADEQNRLAQEQMAERLYHAEQLTQTAEQLFTKQFEGVDWEDLRVTDPAEYSARKQEQKEVFEGLESFKQNIGQRRQQLMNEQFGKAIHYEAEKLTEAIPDWSDPKLAKQEKEELRDYLLSSGLHPNEIDGSRDSNGNILSSGIIDHRLISIARKAMLYDKGNQKVEVTKKRVRKVPKMAKPGKPESVTSVNKAKEKAKRDRLRKSGKLEDAVSLIYHSMET